VCKNWNAKRKIGGPADRGEDGVFTVIHFWVYWGEGGSAKVDQLGWLRSSISYCFQKEKAKNKISSRIRAVKDEAVGWQVAMGAYLNDHLSERGG